jgi:hypothetical protein
LKGNPKATAEAYLKLLRRDQIRPLGPSDLTAATITPADQQFLSGRLGEDRKFNNLLLVSAVVLLYAIFILAALLMWHYRDQPKQIAVCFGGSFFSLTLIVRWLRQLWIDKNFIDLIRSAASKLSPLEVAKLISTYYELMLKGDKKK